MRRKLEERNRIPDTGSIGWIMEETAGAAAIPQSALRQPAPFTQGSLSPSPRAPPLLGEAFFFLPCGALFFMAPAELIIEEKS